jgi:DNA topoisomerase IB
MGNVAPTVMTSGAEWVERLRAVPTNPVMSPETLRHYAEYAGRRLLNYMDENNGEFPSAAQTHIIMDIHRIAPTVSYADL